MTEKKHRILIVEDEEDIIEFSRKNFLRHGYDVRSTPSGKEAIEIIKSFKPELVLLDYALAESDGKEVLTTLRQFDQKTPVYMITGNMFRDAQDRAEILELGVLGILGKGTLSLKDLMTLVDNFFGGKKKTRDLRKNEDALVGETASVSYRKMFHRLSNLISSMRNRYQDFMMAIEEGDYDNVSADELKQRCLKTLSDVDEVAKDTLEYLYQVKGEFSKTE